MNRDTILTRATDGVAAGGVTMPWWLPRLDDVASMAAQLVPILSVLWLAVQIIGYLRKWRAGR